VIEYFLLLCLKALYITLRKNKLKIDVNEIFHEVKAKYTELHNSLFSNLMSSENYKGGKLINIEIHPPKEEVNISVDEQHNSQQIS
jgi:hypothetical protein